MCSIALHTHCCATSRLSCSGNRLECMFHAPARQLSACANRKFNKNGSVFGWPKGVCGGVTQVGKVAAQPNEIVLVRCVLHIKPRS